MDYLTLIGKFRKIVGTRTEFTAPLRDEQIVTIKLSESHRSAHFVLSMALSKQVLSDQDTFKQDHFLDELLATCDDKRCHWIKIFVTKSPEFLDGPEHSRLRQAFDAHLTRYTNLIRQKPVTDFQRLITSAACIDRPCSTYRIAQQLIRLRLEQVLQYELKRSFTLPPDLLFAPDIFTPTPRIRAVIYHLNGLIEAFVRQYVPEEVQSDETRMLSILSLFLMASRPIAAGCTSFLNHWLMHRELSDPSRFFDYGMVPTLYVAREAVRDTFLGHHAIHQGDKLYVFLYESSGCPFRRGVSMPFGHGRHRCPGTSMAKMVMKQCIEACEALQGDEQVWQSLHVSSVQTTMANTFLTYSCDAD